MPHEDSWQDMLRMLSQRRGLQENVQVLPLEGTQQEWGREKEHWGLYFLKVISTPGQRKLTTAWIWGSLEMIKLRGKFKKD
jgi:hypothetical protein